MNETIKSINSILNHLQYNYGDDYAKSLAAKAQVLLNSSIHKVSFMFVVNKESDYKDLEAHYMEAVRQSLAQGLLEQAQVYDIKGYFGEVGKEFTILIFKDAK